MSVLTRRDVLSRAALLGVGSALSGCVPASRPGGGTRAGLPPEPDLGFGFGQASFYDAVPGERFPIPAVDLGMVDRDFLRSKVVYVTKEKPGTIVIDPQSRYLYLVQEGGTAIRYGVGVGREGFSWSGRAVIRNKQEWPDWYPPAEMLVRQPDIRKQMSKLPSGIGMHGGPGNPLGARAMYLWQGDHDTLYRIHGTLEPQTIGKRVSSGCIRMINQDVVDLYARTPVGTQVVVLAA